jgi:hypothetical protein
LAILTFLEPLLYIHPTIPSAAALKHAALLYISIISDFKKHDIVSALLDFHSQILKLDESYQWEAIVLLALTFQSNSLNFGLLLETRGPWRLDTGTPSGM